MPNFRRESDETMATDPSTWNIVIADDDPDSIGVAQYVLEFSGARVRTAACGSVGLELIRQERPTFLLLDIQMPRMSGWDVLREIRQDDSLRSLLVIALTAHAMAGDRERILEAGFDGYIPKPISPLTLVSEVKAFMEATEVVVSNRPLMQEASALAEAVH
jgi:CheY-like chemotaxis protein